VATLLSLMQDVNFRRSNLSRNLLKGVLSLDTTGIRSSCLSRNETSSDRIGSCAFCNHCFTFLIWKFEAFGRPFMAEWLRMKLSTFSLVISSDQPRSALLAPIDHSEKCRNRLFLLALPAKLILSVELFLQVRNLILQKEGHSRPSISKPPDNKKVVIRCHPPT